MENAGSPDINIKSLRDALGAFVTGVTVVAVLDENGDPRGFTANSFTSVSLHPPLVLICVDQSAASFKVFERADFFAVSVLSEHQRDISVLFASKRADKFQTADWSASDTRSPVIADALSWLDCATRERTLVGDHLILIGEVKKIGGGDGRPLGYFRGGYVSFNAGQQALDTPKASIFGALVEAENKILLCRRQGESWSIPSVPHPEAGVASGRTALGAACRALGTDADLNFIYSVFTLDNNATFIVYRGRANRIWEAPDGSMEKAFFAFDEIPWECIDDNVASMLRRYVKERAGERFGIYVESENGGEVVVVGDPTSYSRYIAP